MHDIHLTLALASEHRAALHDRADTHRRSRGGRTRSRRATAVRHPFGDVR